MSFEDEFTALICPRCGGEIELTQVNVDDFVLKTGTTLVYIGAQSGAAAKCAHCRTTFERRQELQGKPKTGTVTTITTFIGKVTGPIHTGTGDINIKQ